MLHWLVAIAISLVALPSAVHAQGAIPQAVIDECNATARASDLPTCLKKGAIAFEMLELVRTGEFYGTAATPVIESCAAKNETFVTKWVCFQAAAAKAAETADLIGRDNIADRCVAEISDPALAAQIREIYWAQLDEWFPGDGYVGIDPFYSFTGCLDPSAEDDPTGSDAQSATDLEGSQMAGLDAAACAALSEVEALVAKSSPDELRAFGADLRAMEEPGPDQVAEALGLTTETSEYLFAKDEEHIMTVSTTLGAFLDEHHPDLLLEFLDQSGAPTSEASDATGSEAARGFLAMVLVTARARYQTSCQG